MKVTPSQQSQTQQAQNTKPARPLDGAQILETESAPVAGTRTFANVLDSTPNPDDGLREPRRGEELETADQQLPARGPEERKTFKTDDDVQLVSVAASVLPLNTPIDGPDLSAPSTAREILPAADLDNILLTVRTDIVEGGQPQTIIDLPRSVLEGLRVRLSTDRMGRISAEFVARTEAVRAQVDARSSELVDMLRFRGLNLSALRTSVSSDLNGGNDSNNRHRPPTGEAPSAARTVAVGDRASSTEVSRQESDSEDSYTYRA
jgi:hypothetical protein